MKSRVWSRQPQTYTRADSSALARYGICGGFIVAGDVWPPLNIVQGAPIAASNASFSTVSNGRGGLAGEYVGTLSGIMSHKTGAPDARSFTMLARVKFANTSQITMRSNTSGNGTTIPMWLNGGWDMRINGTDYTSAGSVSAGVWYDVEIVGSASACQIYVDGALVLNGGAAAAGALDADMSSGVVAGYTASTGDFTFSHVLWSNKALDAQQRAALRANPYQLLSPAVRQRRAFSIAAGGNTIAVPAGSLVLTGFAPVVTATANQRISVPAGSLTLTANAPTVTASDHKTVAVPAGALTLTGFAPTVSVTAGNTINVPAGALSLTAFAPVVSATANQRISVPAGALTLTAFAPTITSNANQTVNVPAGALSLTGFAPTVTATANQIISVPAGALTLTGYAPTVSNGEAAAAPIGGGGYPARADKDRRYGLIPPPTKERLAALVKAQREALGILPRPAQKRVLAAAKKAAAKPEPSLQLLAPAVVSIAQTADLPAVDVARAVEQSFLYAQALRQARATIDAAQRQQRAQVVEQQRQQQEAQAAEAARAQHLARLRADDEALLQFMAGVRGQAIEALRMAQQHLMSLIQ